VYLSTCKAIQLLSCLPACLPACLPFVPTRQTDTPVECCWLCRWQAGTRVKGRQASKQASRQARHTADQERKRRSNREAGSQGNRPRQRSIESGRQAGSGRVHQRRSRVRCMVRAGGPACAGFGRKYRCKTHSRFTHTVPRPPIRRTRLAPSCRATDLSDISVDRSVGRHDIHLQTRSFTPTDAYDGWHSRQGGKGVSACRHPPSKGTQSAARGSNQGTRKDKEQGGREKRGLGRRASHE